MQKTNEINYRVAVPMRRYFPIICLLVLGVAVSFGMFLIVHSWEQMNQRSEFESWAKTYTNAVETTLNGYVGALLFLGDFFNNSMPVTRQQFAGFVKSAMPRYPGIQAFGWDPLVKDDERAVYESAARKEGFDDFEFKERSETNTLVRAARREEYVVVYYIHPMEGNRPAFGFDIASNQTRLKAITKAFDTGELSVTGRITLVQETGNQFGVLLLLPIYQQGVPLNTPEERWKSRKGFVVEVLRIGQAVEGALKDFSDEGIRLALYDMFADEGSRLLYHRPSRMSKPTGQPIPAAKIEKGLFFSKTIDFAERQWKILLSPSDYYYQSRKMWQAWVVLFGSLFLTTLLALYMLRKVLYTAQIEQRAEKQAQSNVQLEQEIGERKQLEQELKENRRMIEESQSLAHLGGWVWHIDTNANTWSDEMFRIFGYEPDAIVPSYDVYSNALHPGDRGRVLESVQRSVEKDLPFAEEYRIIRLDGSVRIVQATGNVHRDKKGHALKMVGAVLDITERKQAEAVVRESEEKYRNLFNFSNDAIFVHDLEGNVLDVNQKALDQFGYTRSEMLSIKISEFHLPEALEKSRWAFETIIREGFVSFEIDFKKETGEVFPAEVSSSLFEIGDKKIIQGIIRDITERKQHENQMRSALKEKEVLLREIHHRVKNNMQVITSLLRLQSTKIKEKQYADMLKDSQSRIKSMALVHEKLYQSEDFAEVDFNGYVKALVNSLFRSYGANPAKIALRIEVDDVSLELDHAIPCGLIINELVSNALKYAFPEDREGEVRVALGSIKEGEFELTVSDNGIGMPEQIDFRNTESLGLHLVTILAEDQLLGNMELNRVGGTKYCIEFKKEREKTRV